MIVIPLDGKSNEQKTITQTIRKKIHSKQCSKCKEINCLEANVFTGYYHFGKIPLASMGKKAVIECLSCEHTFQEFEFSPKLKELVSTEKRKLKIPLWHYSGIFLGMLPFIFIIISAVNSDMNTKRFAKDPQVNDVYKYKTEVEHYSLFKITEVTEDSIYVIFNEYEFMDYNVADLNRLDEPDKYNQEEFYSIAKTTILEMLEDNEILDVDRN